MVIMMSDPTNSISKEAFQAFLYDEIKTTYRFSSDLNQSATIFNDNKDEIENRLKRCLQELPALITQVDIKEHKGFLDDLYRFLFKLAIPENSKLEVKELEFLNDMHSQFKGQTKDTMHLFNQREISGSIGFDVIRHIFEYIPPEKDTLGAAKTCRHFNAFWQEQRKICQAKAEEEMKSKRIIHVGPVTAT